MLSGDNSPTAAFTVNLFFLSAVGRLTGGHKEGRLTTAGCFSGFITNWDLKVAVDAMTDLGRVVFYFMIMILLLD